MIPLAAFGAWQVALRAGTGMWALLTSGNNNTSTPLIGLAHGFVHYVNGLPETGSLVWFGELAVLALVGTLAAISLRNNTAPLHERIAWVATALLAVSLTKAIWLGDVGFRSLDDFWLMSGVVLLSSRLRLHLAGLVVAGAWCAVFVELVLFI